MEMVTGFSEVLHSAVFILPLVCILYPVRSLRFTLISKERFSLQRRKFSMFALVLLYNAKGLARKNSLITLSHSHMFSCASRQLHVFAASYNWSTGLPMFFVIGQ